MLPTPPEAQLEQRQQQQQQQQQHLHDSIAPALQGLQLPQLQHSSALAQLHSQLLSTPAAEAGACGGPDHAPKGTPPLLDRQGPGAAGVQVQGMLQAFGSQFGGLPAAAQQPTATTQQQSAACTGPSDLMMFCMEAAAAVMARQQVSK
jgi:hypothetical protein